MTHKGPLRCGFAASRHGASADGFSSYVESPCVTLGSDDDEFRESRVGKGATIGANATVICGNDLGQYSFSSV